VRPKKHKTHIWVGMNDTLHWVEKGHAESYLAAIINSSDDAIVSKDLNGNIISWNPGAQRIFGYTPEEAVGRHITLIIPPDRTQEEDLILSKIRKGERIDHFETIRRTKDGRLINISVTISPIRAQDGTIIGASKVARDVTELKKAERISAYLSAIIESSDDAIISKDLNGFITSWNRSAERIFGYKAEEVVGRHITIIIPAERMDEEDKILTTLKDGRRIEHFETVRRHRDGHPIYVSLTVSPIRDAAGHIIGASKVSRDITDRIRAEQELREMSRKKDEFLANMSHELRTPMNAVIGLANLLQTTEGMPDKARKFIATLKISADNLMDLINDLLDFTRIGSDSFEIETVEFDLAEQLQKALSVTSLKAREKNINLQVHYDPALTHCLLGDPLRIHQILVNLLSNAIKFTERGSIEVNISCENAEKLGIRVSDTGIGIPEDKLDTIFDKFMQADSSMTRRYGGSGLGLAITRSYIEKMGGSIEVRSELGVGTTFLVTLPLKQSSTPSAQARSFVTTLTEKPRQNKNVLLVDDYEPNLMVAEAMLERLGFDYDTAHNGFEALRQFSQNQYDMVIMDIQMPEMDGLEATRRIRRMEEERSATRTPIIAMSAHVREQDKNKCLEAGMDDFIPKPFVPEELFSKITRYLPQSSENRHASA
jgi:PAS domain S-box-containing protein